MTINLMARGTTAPPLRPGHRRRLLTVSGHRRLLTVSGLAGVGYSLSWIAGLAVPAPSPGFGASGTEIVAALSGHGPAVAAQFALTEGLPAAGIAVIAVTLALTAPSAPGPAHLLFSSVDRLDGVKMLALAVLGAAAATMVVLPRWLRWTGIALAVAITCSGLVYLLLIAPLAAAAGPALVLLLAFMTGCGIMTGMTAGPRER